MAGNNRAVKTRAAWLSTLKKHRLDFDGPGSDEYWSPKLDTASRDEIIAIQNDKLAMVTPFLYENSPFYRARFDRLGLAPTDIATVDDLPKWPVLDKSEMMEDAAANPPYGTYTTIDDDAWQQRGWMLFRLQDRPGCPGFSDTPMSTGNTGNGRMPAPCGRWISGPAM